MPNKFTIYDLRFAKIVNPQVAIFFVFLLGFCLFSLPILAQDAVKNRALKKYNPTNTILFDLVHTKLEIKPNWQTQQLDGKANITLKPHFYSQNQLELDAKGFAIASVKLKGKTLKYSYDKRKLLIDLEKNYTRKDTLAVEISYTAKPNELIAGGSEAIMSDKGLYFINPLKTEANKPQQIWTQGETEASSCWFPTIDSPNQKMTQEILLTVDNQYITLSNGKLISSTKNADGTRTDYWKQTLPAAPYLTMFAVGDFKKIVDPRYKNFEVSYYVEPKFEKEALKIFGRTPEMITLFEKLTGVKYVWEKYAQIVVRDYVSGAMENTTATIHGESVQKDANQLIDDNDDGVIAHELFHHWFGNLVTCESWSNLPLNESFATYAEYLWSEHKYGKDEADLVGYNALNEYLSESEEKREPMIRFNYADKEDMFDAHSYSKGGKILHQLRKEVGDEAFFAALNDYLTKNAFKSAEIEDLRISFERVTGRDLNWFFDQWFKTAGHPVLEVKQNYNNQKLSLTIRQLPDSVTNFYYRLPLKVLIGKETKDILLTEAEQIFEFSVKEAPKMVLLDPENTLIGEIRHQKSEAELIEQYHGSESALNRLKAIELLTQTSALDTLGINPNQKIAIRKILIEATKDKFWRIRQVAVQKLFDYDGDDFLSVEKALQTCLADERSYVRADAILAMKNFQNPANEKLFRKALTDSSYTVRGAALEAILVNNPADAAELVKQFEGYIHPSIFASVANYYAMTASPEKYEWFEKNLQAMQGNDLYQILGIFGTYLLKSSADIQQKSLPLLEKIAKDNAWYVRFAGVQVLALLTDNEAAMNLLKKAIKEEKNERLRKLYDQYKAD